jgi:putative ABC transport system permease protein
MTGDRGIPRSFPFPGDITAVRDAHIISVIGRMAPGVTRQQAQSQLAILMDQLAAQHPETNAGLGVNVMPLHEQIVGNVRPLVVLLQAAVAVLLLIACANVAHLLLGQAAGRQSEMSLRMALGAGRSRLVRQLLAETLLIAIPGGLAGLALALLGVRALVAVAPASIPRLDEIAIDGTVLVFSVAITLVTTAVFGLWPALQTARTSADGLAQGSQRVAGQRSVRRSHQAVVIGELALAQVLLVGAGLLLVSFVQATRIDLGFAAADRITAELNLVPGYVTPTGEDGRIDPARKIRYINTVLDSVRQAPGVRAVAASFTSPLTGAPNRGIRIEGDPPARPDDQPNADFQVVSTDFFTALGIPLVAGRAFDSSDRINSPPVAIINQALADRYLAGRDPLGQVLLFGGSRRHQIVGVVADTRYRSVEQPPDPTFYLPLEQNDERWPFLAFTVWMESNVASGSSRSSTVSLLRAAISGADPLQPISRIRSVDEILDAALAPRRFNTWVIGLFAVTALALAAVGIYGVMSFSVSTRTRELGVRAALGATPGSLVRLMFGQGLLLTLSASAIGLIAAGVLTRFMASMLYGVTARDPLTFGLVAGVLSLVALIATLVPARRASKLGVGDLFRA